MTRKPPKGKSLAEVNPKLAKEWHPTKNGEITPSDVSKSSGRKVWWKCDKGEDHEWESTVNSRASGRGCPVCRGLKVVLSNCLATLNPILSKEWHQIKNDNLTPYDVTLFSSKKVWWKCDKGEDHEWESSVRDRANGNGCPVCSGTKVALSNCLATLNSILSKEWHPIKNGNLTPYDLTLGSNKKVWWKCDKGEDHEWETRVIHRSKGSDCPICDGKITVLSNSLATLNPKLAKEWHPTKNENISPRSVNPFSNKIYWWKCDKGEDHEWQSNVANRSNDKGCPICSGHKTVLSNCLATLNPKLAKEWHPTKNKELTPLDVTIGSSQNVWWKCDKGEDHEWKSNISNRGKKGQGCPYCTLTPQSKQELTITFELIEFFEMNPKGFKSRVNGKIMSIDIYISELNLGIEFDGSYWHKGKREFDKLKTQKLESEGFTIMRVREEPLKAITDIDVISKTPFNAKLVTNEILIHIMDAYNFDAKKIKKIKEYLIKDSIQNEKGLDAYIDKILNEKAERKSLKK